MSTETDVTMAETDNTETAATLALGTETEPETGEDATPATSDAEADPGESESPVTLPTDPEDSDWDDKDDDTQAGETDPEQSEVKDVKPPKKGEKKVAAPGGNDTHVDIPTHKVFEEIPALESTELGNTLRFIKIYTGLLFFHHLLKQWFCWDSKRWVEDSSNRVLHLLINVLLKDGSFRANVSSSWFRKSFSNSTLRAALKIAADLLPLPAPLDSHPFLLNVNNGTIDLKTGKLMKHKKENYITKLAPVDYDPKAQCPLWLAFLNKAFNNDNSHIRYLQKAIGYALTSSVAEKCFFIFYGPTGNNGKSLLINVLRAILGVDYRVQLAAESLTVNRVSAIRSDIARLKGFRFASASETDKTYKFNEPLIKTLTGADAVTARKLYANEIEFVPEIKLFIATNSKPQFNLSDRAMMSRVNVIPFNVSVPPEEQDRELTDKLIGQEAAGILAWAVEGAVLWAREGLGPNPFPQEESVIMITFADFIKKYCATDKNSMVRTVDLLVLYNYFKTEMGDDSPDLKIREFDQLLKGAGYEPKHERDGNYRHSIKLNDAGAKLLEELVPPPAAPSNGLKDEKGVKDENTKKPRVKGAAKPATA